MDITIDNQIMLAGSNELRHEGMRLPRKSYLLLRHQTSEKASRLLFSPEIDEAGEQIMGFEIHDHVVLPSRTEKILVALGNIFGRYSLTVVNDRHADRIDSWPIPFRVHETFPQERNQWTPVACEDLPLDQLGNVQAGQSHNVSLIGASAIFRRNFIENSRPSETNKSHFDRRISLVESVKDLLRVAQVSRGIKCYRAFF